MWACGIGRSLIRRVHVWSAIEPVAGGWSGLGGQRRWWAVGGVERAEPGVLPGPRFGQVLLYSTAGVTLLLGMGVAAIEIGRPEWIWIVPAQTHAQLMMLVGMVAFGAVVQWQRSPTPPAGGSSPAPKK